MIDCGLSKSFRQAIFPTISSSAAAEICSLLKMKDSRFVNADHRRQLWAGHPMSILI